MIGLPLRPRRALALASLALLASCARRADEGGETASAAAPPPAATPVHVAEVEIGDVARTVGASGRTRMLVQHQVRAPFAGTLTSLAVGVGDAVRPGQAVGTIVASDSEAALGGAEEMLREAKTPVELADARRAVELARQDMVERTLRSAVSGVVVETAAAGGDRVSQDQALVTVAARDSLVFVADLAQGELVAVHEGQEASVALSGHAEPLEARVRGVLAGAEATGSTVPLRLDFREPPRDAVGGLFGTASIVVERHAGVPLVPAAAVLTDDLSGTRRLAAVGADGKAHWVEVRTDLAGSGRVEVTSPALAAGTKVIVSGQVGLPEGAPVDAEP